MSDIVASIRSPETDARVRAIEEYIDRQFDLEFPVATIWHPMSVAALLDAAELLIHGHGRVSPEHDDAIRHLILGIATSVSLALRRAPQLCSAVGGPLPK